MSTDVIFSRVRLGSFCRSRLEFPKGKRAFLFFAVPVPRLPHRADDIFVVQSHPK